MIPVLKKKWRMEHYCRGRGKPYQKLLRVGVRRELEWQAKDRKKAEDTRKTV